MLTQRVIDLWSVAILATLPPWWTNRDPLVHNPDMGRRLKKAVPIGDVIAGIVASQEAGNRKRTGGRQVFKVFSAFDKLGPPITRHAEPIQFRSGTLTLMVGESAWLTELSFLREEILRRINEALGKETVKELRFRHGRLSEGRAKPQARPAPKLSEEQARTLESWADQIKNPEIREAMRSAARWTFSKS